MRWISKKLAPYVLPIALFSSLIFMQCEPGNPIPVINPPDTTTVIKPVSTDSTKVLKITLDAQPNNLLPGDTGLVQLSITGAISDTSKFVAHSGATLTVSADGFSLLKSASNSAFDLTKVPSGGKLSFRVVSNSPGKYSVNVSVMAGSATAELPITIIVSEKPVKPVIKDPISNKLKPNDTTLVKFQIVDSVKEKGLANAVVSLTNTDGYFSIYTTNTKDTVISDTTLGDGFVTFRLLSKIPGATGTVQVKVKTAAGIEATKSFTFKVEGETGVERPRKMVFTADRSTLRADGSDFTLLKVLVKDDNNNPLEGEDLTFTATGGVVEAKAKSDKWGLATATLRSERVNRSVTVTVTLVKTGATATQTVAFDGITINIAPSKRILMVGQLDPILFELKDGAGVPMSGDSLEVVVKGADKGFDQKGKDSMIVVTDTRGQFKTYITSQVASDAIMITSRALGAKSVDTITYTSNTMTLSASKASIFGDGVDASTITATLKDGAGANLDGKELRWTTTFGTFGSSPFTLTSGGSSSIVLKSVKGSGLAVINVEAYTKNGDGSRSLVASGNITVPIKALKVAKLILKVTPDNIPVKIGETKLVAQAYDSVGNVMTGVLIGFRLVKGAGGGDEVITPPVDYSKAGQAEAILKAGGVISSYQGVKLTAVALDLVGTDTLVIASSDTVGLTISGPPNRLSVGCNISKGLNDNDGTYGLPCAAVVTDVNGNLVADGTPTNFSTTPIGSYYDGSTYHIYYTGYGANVIIDSVQYFLPWGDYNNNGKLDPGEESSKIKASRPARGEDIDGNGYINFPPEKFKDWNNNGVWDHTDSTTEPGYTFVDSTGKTYGGYVDWNKNGHQDTIEYFYDDNNDGICQCTGTFDAAGNLYEDSYSGNTKNHPFPGEAAIGVIRQVETVNGKALNKIVYVQTMARHVKVRVTAEANGIRGTVDVDLPVILDK